MHVQRVHLGTHHYTWLVIDNDYLPVKPIASYLSYLTNIEKSPNTVQAYANHLKLFWEFLTLNEFCWKSIKLNNLAEFINWLRHERGNIIALKSAFVKRQPSTVNAILTAVSSFYRYFNQLGVTDISLTENTSWRTGAYKGLLYHIYKNKPRQKRLLKLKNQHVLPKHLTQTQVKELLNATTHPRDYFLVHLLFETGLRIGQALRLRHEDIKSWDNVILIQPSDPKLHQSQNKSQDANIIHVSPVLIQSYSNYLTRLEGDIRHEFVFVNLLNYAPLSYNSIRKLFIRLSHATKITVTPHMLRHTHATELLRAGWDPSFVQKRLGHRHIQTTLDIYNHISIDDLKEAYKTYLAKREIL